MTTRGEPTKEFLYLGTVEITREGIALDPEPEDPSLRATIFTDLVNEASWRQPWGDADPPLHPDPDELLQLVADGIFETVRDEAEDEGDERTLALANEALADGPYTGALYAVGIALLPPVALRFSVVEPLGFRNGTIWRNPQGEPLTGDERAATTRAILEDIRTRNPFGL